MVLIQDADLEYDPQDYLKLLQPIVDDKADVVYGSRFIGEPHRVLYYWHTLGNKFLTWFSNMLHEPEPDRHGGLLQGVPQGRAGSHPRSSATALALSRKSPPRSPRCRPRLRIYEVGVAYYGRSYEEGKKITWKDGIKAILTIIRFRFTD